MFLKPATLALLLVSLTGSGMILLAAFFAVKIVRYWDISSGSELQLQLEWRTYLISTLLGFCFVAELVALLLFIVNAESMSGQFVGAMCATGVLNVNGFGWPVLFLKIALFFCGAAWLVLNHVDNLARDYPLIRIKYSLLLGLVPLMLTETVLLFLYFLGLDPDVITSCCGTLFSADAQGVAGEISGVAPGNAMIMLISSGVVVLGCGIAYGKWKRGGLLFAAMAIAAFLAALIAIPSVIALYIYEHPHHHCPFCILKSEYDYIGYFLYITLFGATAFALGVGILSPWKRRAGLQEILTRVAGHLAWYAFGLYSLFYILVAMVIIRSNLSLTTVW